MTENSKTYSRWYDQDDIVSKCVRLLETLPDPLKRQTATFIMDKIIDIPPFLHMPPEEVFKLATADDKKRRWYDFDEVVRIFLELLRYSDEEARRSISITAITFIEEMIMDKDKSIEITDKKDDEFWFLSSS